MAIVFNPYSVINFFYLPLPWKELKWYNLQIKKLLAQFASGILINNNWILTEPIAAFFEMKVYRKKYSKFVLKFFSQ